MVFISKYFKILNSDRKMRELNLRQVDRQSKVPCGGKHSFIHFFFPLSQGKTCFFYTLYWYCNNVPYPRTDLSLGPELMITQHNVLLMEMLFLGSMLMIIIVTNLAWEPVSQQQNTSPKDLLPGTLSFWLILYWSYLSLYALG